MRCRVAVAAFVLAAAVAEAGPGSVFDTGLRIEQREVVVHRGSSVHALVHWDRGEGPADVDDLLLRWQLRGPDGEILDEGHRWGDPRRFRVRSRVPLRTEPYRQATLEVSIDSGAAIVAAASARIWIQPGRFVVHPRRPVVVEGVLEDHPWRGPVLRADVEGVERIVTLAGPGMAAVLRHPDRSGERIRVTGVEAGKSGAHIVMALSVEWLDDPPERLAPLDRRRYYRGTVPIPEGVSYEDIDAYRAFMATTQTPSVAETKEEYLALRQKYGVPANFAPDIDFLEERAIVVCAGNSPDTSFSTSVGEAWFVPRAGRTVVRYDVIQSPGWAFFAEQRTFEIVVLHRRAGDVVFRRREWVGVTPSYWPRLPPE